MHRTSLSFLLATAVSAIVFAAPDKTSGKAADAKPADTKPADAETTAPKTDHSIIDPKYRDRYKDKVPDFVDDLIEQCCRTKSDDGKTGELNPSLIIDLAAKNAVSEDDLKNMRASIGQKNAPGRIRMTIANMLRARAKRRHGLNNLGGTFMNAPAGSVFTSADKTENPDGSKIAKAKAETPSTNEKAPEAKAADASTKGADTKPADTKQKPKKAA